MTNGPVRTRFAPSPTGYLHVGGARTALFCWLWARKHGGQFILRIEDTDKARNTAESLVGILEDLAWLGLAWDEGPDTAAVRAGRLESIGPHASYFQSQRDPHYARYYSQLLQQGDAYFAWETPAELEAARKAANAAKLPYRYQRPHQLITDEAHARALAGDRPIVIRFKSPQTPIVVDDLVLGTTTFPADHVDDLVIRKADGGPTYHFAVICDDHDMRISHVIRAQEHFNNTPKHVAMLRALGLDVPLFAHLPLVFNEGGGKMSKRDKDKAVKAAAKNWLKAAGNSPQLLGERAGDPQAVTAWLAEKDNVLQDGALRERVAGVVGLSPAEIPEIDVNDFRRSGYLPETLLNYIALLGWSEGNDREKYPLDQLVQAFDLARIVKTNARFDRKKLIAFNTQAAEALAAEPAGRTRLREALADYLSLHPQSPLYPARHQPDLLDSLLRASAGFRVFRDIEDKCGVLFQPDQAYPFDPAAVQKNLLKADSAGLKALAAARDALASLPEWTEPAIEAAVRSLAEARAEGLGSVAQPIRVAVTGATISPPIGATLVLLGKDRSLARIDRCLHHARNPAH